ncbi:MAG: CehA/McbA family metallohydrolase [Lachnospiraceae bacterium]|nr:CehA/McbA family metallohydrolase [Lachnospiraceae bacterium]
MYIDQNGKKWYKGNLHTHSTRSDGRLPVEIAEGLYREAGYDFLAFTDHWVMGEGRREEDFLMLSGCEFDCGSDVENGIFHIVGIGLKKMPSQIRRKQSALQEIIDGIHEEDGIAILAHPAWSLNRVEDVIRFYGLDGVEIYNTASGLPWNCRPYSGEFIDAMASKGILLPCMAADDTHHYTGDETRSYIMVNAEDLTRDAIMEAIRCGRFYASQGPRFSVENVSMDGVRYLHVTSTPVQSIAFFTNLVWEDDRAVCGDNVQEAYYQVKPDTRFVRVELTDRQGRCAWSSFEGFRDC